jgi:hypothetical protein
LAEHLLLGLASIVVLGIGAQWLAWQLYLPATLLLLIFGTNTKFAPVGDAQVKVDLSGQGQGRGRKSGAPPIVVDLHPRAFRDLPGKHLPP